MNTNCHKLPRSLISRDCELLREGTQYRDMEAQLRNLSNTFSASSLVQTPKPKSSKKPKNTIDQNAEEINLRHRNLRNDNVNNRLEKFSAAVAIDLSFNRLDSFPRGLPETVRALNLSHNAISSLSTFVTHCHIVELHLKGNAISRCVSRFVIAYQF